MSDDLHELAERGKASRQAMAKQKRKPPAVPAAPREKKLSKVVKLTLRKKSFMWLLMGCLMLTFGPVSLVVATLDLSDATTFGLILGPAAVATAAALWFVTSAPKRELTWLASVGFGLDVDAYLQAIDREQQRGSFEVRVRFHEPVSEDERRLVADAAIGASGAKMAKFQGDDLVILSASFTTYFPSSNAGSSSVESYHSNAALHQWFRKLVRDGLPAINRSYPIADLSVSMKGS